MAQNPAAPESLNQARTVIDASVRLKERIFPRLSGEEMLSRDEVDGYYQDLKTVTDLSMYIDRSGIRCTQCACAWLSLYEYPSVARLYCLYQELELVIWSALRAYEQRPYIWAAVLGPERAARCSDVAGNSSSGLYQTNMEALLAACDKKVIPQRHELRRSLIRERERCWPFAATAPSQESGLLADLIGVTNSELQKRQDVNNSDDLPIIYCNADPMNRRNEPPQSHLLKALHVWQDRELMRRALMRYLASNNDVEIAGLCFDRHGDEGVAEQLRLVCKQRADYYTFQHHTRDTHAVVTYLDSSLGPIDELVAGFGVSKGALGRWRAGKVNWCNDMHRLLILAAFVFDAKRVLGDDPELLRKYVSEGAASIGSSDRHRLWSDVTYRSPYDAMMAPARVSIDRDGHLVVE